MSEKANINDCGGCTMCCKLLAVPEFGKPCNVWCNYCNVGQSCRIYNGRPESCRKFVCGYISRNMPVGIRPDKTRVVFEIIEDNKLCLVLQEQSRQNAWNEPKVLEQIKSLLADGYVVVVNGKRQHMMLPEGRTQESVIEELKELARKASLALDALGG